MLNVVFIVLSVELSLICMRTSLNFVALCREEEKPCAGEKRAQVRPAQRFLFKLQLNIFNNIHLAIKHIFTLIIISLIIT